jgi:hypothetical protein
MTEELLLGHKHSATGRGRAQSLEPIASKVEHTRIAANGYSRRLIRTVVAERVAEKWLPVAIERDGNTGTPD